jgi:hypothetical protein
LLGSRFLIMQQMYATIEEMCFLCGLYWDVISKGHSSFQFCMGGCEERTWAHEAKESPLIAVIAREWLVKAQQAVKGLVGAVGISGGYVIACTYGGNDVLYRPVVKQWLCKQWPFLGSGSVNTFTLLCSRFLTHCGMAN